MPLHCWRLPALLLLLAFPPLAHAQLPLLTGGAADSSTATDAAKPAAESLEAKREEVARKLQTARRALQSDGASPGGAPGAEKVSREVELLGQLDLALSQQQSIAEQAKELAATRDELQTRLDAFRGAEACEIESITFLDLDRIRDELATEKSRGTAFKTGEATAGQALARAKAIAAEKERDRLKANEALKTNRDEGSAGRLAQQLAVAEHEARLAAETAALREAQLAVEKLNHEVHALRVALLTSQIERHAPSAQFTQADLDARLDELAGEEGNLREKIALAERALTTLDARWVDRKRELDVSADAAGALREEVEYLRLARQTRQQEISILGQRLERQGRMRAAYKRRFAVITAAPLAAELKTWESETRQYLEQLAQEARLHNVRADQLRKDQMSLEARVQAAQALPPETSSEILLQRKELDKLSTVYDANFVSIAAARQLHEKLLAEIGTDVDSLSAAERAGVAWQWLLDAWNYPLMSVDDRPITPGKIIAGIALLLAGYWGSRRVARLLGRRILPRVGLNEGASAAMQSLAFYSLVALVTLLALHLVNVPLTLFTFLGGALAIGVGFGSQNIVNNFISGLILLAERPIRHGDTIQLDGLAGTIEHIGARSTRVRTATNVEIIVPNSRFLENNVVNWTLSDDKIRTSIKLGVAYSSPTRDVARLLKRAADEHGLIMRNPEPFVWFTDFGDNALQFELHFWVTMRTLSERLRIESDIRHRIDLLFREAGIVMAYPQRDVHLDAVRPLEVRVLPAESGAAADDAQSSPRKAA
jgi:small-conductance mechanosensitive channel